MNITDYTHGALRTESPGKPYDTIIQDHHKAAVLLNILGVIRANGENCDLTKRGLFYGKPWRPSTEGLASVPQNVADAMSTDQFKRMTHAVLGMASELAEMVDILLWMAYNGGALLPTPEPSTPGVALTAAEIKNTPVHAGEEYGDVQWYEAIWADAAGFNPNTSLVNNLLKLRRRYPEKFTEEHALNRLLDSEAEALTGAVAV